MLLNFFSSTSIAHSLMSWKGETHWTTRPKGRISAATFSQKECPRYSLHYFLLKYLLICYTNLRCLSSGENMIHQEYFNLYSAKFSLDIMLCSASAVWVIFKESEQSVGTRSTYAPQGSTCSQVE